MTDRRHAGRRQLVAVSVLMMCSWRGVGRMACRGQLADRQSTGIDRKVDSRPRQWRGTTKNNNSERDRRDTEKRLTYLTPSYVVVLMMWTLTNYCSVMDRRSRRWRIDLVILTNWPIMTLSSHSVSHSLDWVLLSWVLTILFNYLPCPLKAPIAGNCCLLASWWADKLSLHPHIIIYYLHHNQGILILIGRRRMWWLRLIINRTVNLMSLSSLSLSHCRHPIAPGNSSCSAALNHW